MSLKLEGDDRLEILGQTLSLGLNTSTIASGASVQLTDATMSGGPVSILQLFGTLASEGASAISLGTLSATSAAKIYVSSGILNVTQAANSFTNAGTLTLLGGATFKLGAWNSSLTNTGLIRGNGTIDMSGGTVVSTGTLAPNANSAAGFGTLSILGGASLTSGAAELDLGSESVYDRIHVSGNLTTGAQLQMRLNGSGTAIAGGNAFTLLTAGGGTSGTPSLVNNIPGKTFSLAQTGGDGSRRPRNPAYDLR